MPTVIVEDGTGLTNSNSYQSLIDFKAYMADIGEDITTFSDDQIDQALIMTGSDYMELNYSYCGEITFPENPQAISFPRTGLTNRHGADIPDSGVGSIFPDLIKAQAQLTLGQLRAGGTLNVDPDKTNQGAVILNKLDVMTQAYGPAGSELAKSTFNTYQSYANRILSPYICGGNNPFQGNNRATT